MNRNNYFGVCIIILLFTLCIITHVKADIVSEKQLPPSQKDTISEHNTIEKDQITTENIKTLLQPVIFIFKIFYATVSYIWTFILYVLSPVFWVLRALYNVFILTPYTITQKINSYFYPLYMFLATAALLGVLVGGMAGWFSEVMAKFLITPKSDESEREEEDNRMKTEKLKRRAQALANLRARNGGRLPEEFYDRYASVQNKQGIIHQNGMMEGYGTNPYYSNMGYRSYESSGVGES